MRGHSVDPKVSSQKPDIEGGLPKKGGLGQFTDLRGGLVRKKGGGGEVFLKWGVLTPLETINLPKQNDFLNCITGFSSK